MQDALTVGAAVGIAMAGLKVAEASIKALSVAIKRRNGVPEIYKRVECPVHGNCLGSELTEAVKGQADSAKKSEGHLNKMVTSMALIAQNQADEKTVLASILKDTRWLTALDAAKARQKAKGVNDG